MQARCCIIRDIIKVFIVAWHCVQASGIGDSSLTDVEEVLKIPYYRLLR